nr:MAG TPA: endonuclease [Caudoviricetes sp.]
MVKSVKIRIYPNATQLKAITDILDACRFVKNKYLEYNIDRHSKGEEFINGNEFVKIINKLKKEDEDYLWLDAIYSKAIKYAIKEEDSYLNAYYTKRKSFPGFIAKNRVDNESYYFIKDSIQYISKNVIQLPALGNTRITSGDKLLPDRDSIKSGRIVRNYNKYYVVFIYDTEGDNKNMVKNDITLGIAIATNNNDYIVTYDGNECRHYKSYRGLDTYKHIRERMGKLEQVVSIKSDYNFNRLFNNYMNEHGTSPNEEEKEKMREESYNTSNIRRVQLKINKCRIKLDNIVDDFIKKLVNELTVKIKPYQINLEDLDMIDIPDDETQRIVQMLMEETNFHKFKNRLINKCKEYGIKLWAVSSDRFSEYEDLLEKK